MLEYGFYVLNLNNIMLKVYAFNKRAANAYQKAGFKVLGIRRQAKIFAGKKWDEIYMEILAEEFTGSYIKDLVNEELSTDV